MNRYKVRVYTASALGFFTQADHYEDHFFDSGESLEQIVKRLGRDGFAVNGGRKWIMPAAILTVELDG